MTTKAQNSTYTNITNALIPSSSSTNSSTNPPNIPLPLIPLAGHTPTPLFPNLSSQIARLELHPTLEACLHMLNNDLPSAHFLLRHMQNVVPLKQPACGNEKDAGGNEAGTWAGIARGAAASESTDASADRPVHGDSGNKVSKEETKGEAGEPKDVEADADADSGRTAQAPKLEGLLLHGILHRIEGDYENARAWYGNVDEASSSHAPHGRTQEATQDAWTTTWTDGLPTAHNFLDRIITLRQSPQHVGDREQELRDLTVLHRQELSRILHWCERRYGKGAKWEESSAEFVSMGEKHRDIASKMLVGGEGWRQF